MPAPHPNRNSSFVQEEYGMKAKIWNCLPGWPVSFHGLFISPDRIRHRMAPTSHHLTMYGFWENSPPANWITGSRSEERRVGKDSGDRCARMCHKACKYSR